MDSKLGRHLCCAKVARRAGLLAVSLAVAGCMAVPSAALATVSLSIERDLTAGTGYVRAAGTVPACFFGCGELPVDATLTRGGAVVAPTELGLPSPPQAGDVIVLGVGVYGINAELGRVTFDGRPTLDQSLSCSLVGRTRVRGSFSASYDGSTTLLLAGLSTPGPDDDLFFGDDVNATTSTVGERFTATFPRAIARGDHIRIREDYVVNMPGLQAGPASVSSVVEGTICPGTCMEELRDRRVFAHWLTATLKAFARHGAQGLLAHGRWPLTLMTCDPGTFRGGVTARRRGKTILVAKGLKDFGRSPTSVSPRDLTLRLTRRGRGLLETLRDEGADAIPVRLTTHLLDIEDGSFKQSRRVKLRLSR